MNMAKKKATSSGKIKFVLTYDDEIENLNYQIEWIKIVIQGTKEQEQEEYEEAMGMYKQLGKMFNKEMPKDERLAGHFKTKILSSEKVTKAYEAGYGAVHDKNMANKLLEMGILTHIEWVKDFDSREAFVPNLSN